MRYWRHFAPDMLKESVGHRSCVVLDQGNGCVGECLAGVSQYETDEYPELQTHPFQEGFYVIEGGGQALVDGEEFSIAAGTSFLVPAGKKHALRRGPGEAFVRVFWFHA